MLPYRAPAYAGVGGVGGALVSALFQGLQAPPVPLAPTAAAACPAAGPWAPPAESWPALSLPLAAGLGALLLIFSFVLGVIIGGSGGFALGFLWHAVRRASAEHYGWARVASYLHRDRTPSSVLH